MRHVYYLDIETTANGGPTGRCPEAHWKTNKPLLIGWKKDNEQVVINKSFVSFKNSIQDSLNQNHEVILVGHNIKFDLKYFIAKYNPYTLRDVKIWDTMVFEYFNSGFTDKMMSLEDTAKKRGVPFKKSLDLGALMQSGLKMEDIHTNDLRDYLEDDVEVLAGIYEAQSKVGNYWMQHILPLAEMEQYGVPIDVTKLNEDRKDALVLLSGVCHNMEQYIKHNCQWMDGSPVTDEDFNEDLGTKSKTIKLYASRTLSFLLHSNPSVLGITPKWKLHLKDPRPLYTRQDEPDDKLGYSMDEKQLSLIEEHGGFVARTIASDALQYRKYSKLVDTYYSPFSEILLHTNETIHPKYNVSVTSTGRLSSSSPNGQNLPTEVRQLVFDTCGIIEELDFSQLEIVGAAHMSKCPALIRDLRNGLDIHEQTASKVFGKDKAKEMRKLAKNVNFGVLYGGRANGLSQQTGVDKKTIQDLIDAFYTSYPGVAKWQRKVYQDAIDNMEPYDIKEGEQRYCSELSFPAAKMSWKFIETRSPAWLRKRLNRKWNLSPQHTANYPIQGFAGFGIVMYALRLLWERTRHIAASPILTVHDSIVFVKDQDVDLKEIYDEVMQEINNIYNLPVPLSYDVETGHHWQ